MPSETRLWLGPVLSVLALLPFALVAKYLESQEYTVTAHVFLWTGMALAVFVLSYTKPEQM